MHISLLSVSIQGCLISVILTFNTVYTETVNDATQQALEYVYRVRGSTCTGGTEEVLPLDFDHTVWNKYTDPAIRTANLLSKFIIRNNGTMDNIPEDFFFLLVRNNVHGDSLIFGSAIAVETGVYTKYSVFCPYAFKKNNTVRSHDISINYNYLDPSTEWYNVLKSKSWTNVTIVTDGIKYRQDNTLLPEVEEMQPIAELSQGHWTNPYYDCGGGDIWMVTYSSPIFMITNGVASFRGVATIDIELTNIDINQCDLNAGSESQNDDVSGAHIDSSGLDVFRGTHRCFETTECVPVTGLGFVPGAYRCECQAGYYFPNVNEPVKSFDGGVIENYYRTGAQFEASMFMCLKCAEGCDTCVDNSPCLYQRNDALVIVLLVFTVITILVIGCVAVITFLYRTEMVIKSASPIFLEIMCLGGFLMCCQLFCLYPDATVAVCSVRIWPIHLGFFTMYGSLILKTWRISVIFTVGMQKKVRLPDQVLLQRFCLLILVAVGILAAWTGSQPPKVYTLQTGGDLKFYECSYGPWEYTVLGVEVVFLLYGVYLCFTVRKAPAHFNESKHITWAVYNAIILGSFMALMSRLVVSVLGPTLMLLLQFIQIQVYVSVTIALIFAPKFWALYKNIDIGTDYPRTMQSGTVQTITGRIKKSQISPMPNKPITRSVCTQTIDASSIYQGP